VRAPTLLQFKAWKDTDSAVAAHPAPAMLTASWASFSATAPQVLRAAALGTGLVYGSVKLGYLKVRNIQPHESEHGMFSRSHPVCSSGWSPG
jgi:hypothetical protein